MKGFESSAEFRLWAGGRCAGLEYTEIPMVLSAVLGTLWCGNRPGSQTDLNPNPGLQLANMTPDQGFDLAKPYNQHHKKRMRYVHDTPTPYVAYV